MSAPWPTQPGASMQIDYELTREDLHELQLQLALRGRSSRGRLAAALLLAGAAGWTLWNTFTAADPLLADLTPRLVGFAMLFTCAAAVGVLLWRRMEVAGIPAIDQWAARRMTERALRLSVLGPVRVVAGPDGLTRTNEAGELRVPWDEVKSLLRSTSLLTVLRHDARAILLPARAFAEPGAWHGAITRLEALSGKRSIAVGPGAAPPPRPLLRPLLLVALSGAALLFVWQQWLPRYHDPRSGNPDDHVIVYATEWCGACARLRSCLQAHQVPFDERNIETSRSAHAEWWAVGGQSIPVTVAGQAIATGLRREELEPALAKAGHPVDCWSEVDGATGDE